MKKQQIKFTDLNEWFRLIIKSDHTYLIHNLIYLYILFLYIKIIEFPKPPWRSYPELI